MANGDSNKDTGDSSGKEFFDESGSDTDYAFLSGSSGDFDKKEVDGDDWLIATPERVSKLDGRRSLNLHTERVNEISADVDVPDNSEQLEQILGEVEGAMDDISPGDFQDMNQTQLLQEIARLTYLNNQLGVERLRGMNELLSFMSNIMNMQIQQLSTLFTILEVEEPFFGISISGVRTIENANTPQLVVPESDRVDVPTRSLLVRASPQNNADIWIGEEDIGVNAGYQLRPGETFNMSVDIKEMELYMLSQSQGEEVQVLGVV